MSIYFFSLLPLCPIKVSSLSKNLIFQIQHKRYISIYTSIQEGFYYGKETLIFTQKLTNRKDFTSLFANLYCAACHSIYSTQESLYLIRKSSQNSHFTVILPVRNGLHISMTTQMPYCTDYICLTRQKTKSSSLLLILMRTNQGRIWWHLCCTLLTVASRFAFTIL